MINITFTPKTLELEIKGHAGQGKKGEDIVCAAISSLFYTLAQSLYDSSEMLIEEPVFKDEDGNGYISCKPKKEFEGNITRSYWTILVGLELIAHEYKNFVKMTLRG